MEYSSGAIGNLHLAKGGNNPGPMEHYAVFGHGAHLTIDNTNRVALRRGIPFDYGKTTSFAPPGTDSGTVVWEPQNMLGTLENKSAFTQGTYAEMRHFCDYALEDKPATRGTLEYAHLRSGIAVRRQPRCHCTISNSEQLRFILFFVPATSLMRRIISQSFQIVFQVELDRL